MALAQSRGRRDACGLMAASLAGLLVLAACGSVAAPGSSADPAAAGAPGKAAPAQLALCADPSAAQRVVIARTPTINRIQPVHVEPAAQTTVTNGPAVRALARALCALPTMTTGIINCPALLEGTYVLRFTTADRVIPEVTIEASGCKTVTGLGPARTVSKSPGFWPVLARTARAGVTIPPLPVYLPQDPAGMACVPVSTRSTGGTAHCPAQARPGGVSAHTP